MSRPLYRVKSAGASRNPTPGQESFVLKEQIQKLQQELLHSNAERQKATDQLNVLITLVRRSWSGDRTASLHVANIVGAAPPDIQHNIQTNGAKVQLTAMPKSRPLNNWAVLTIGLLNRSYRREERLLEVRQHQYMQQRVSWLEEQELYHRDKRLRDPPTFNRNNSISEGGPPPPTPNPPSLTRRRSLQGNPTPEIQGNRPPNGKKKPGTSGRPMYRPNAVPKTELTWSDLVSDPSKQANTQKQQTTQNSEAEMYPMTSGEVSEYGDYRDDIPYDDPTRYTMFGLYDNDNLGNQNKRPPSGKQQRDSDSMRARPKSAVYGQKQDRPMKYETTRPLSGSKSKASNNSRPNSGTMSSKVKDAKVTGSKVATNQVIKISKPKYEAEDSISHVKAENQLSSKSADALAVSYEDYYEDGGDEEGGEDSDMDDEAAVDPDIAHLLRVDISKPESVLRFEEEMAAMKQMEDQFQRTTMSLQKKLGISTSGMV